MQSDRADRASSRWPSRALGVALLAAGCGDMLPDPNQIVRTRLLAIRTEVTQPLIEDEDATSRAQALPFETVGIVPFIVGPDGPIDADTLDPVWLACELPPGVSLLTCLQDAMPITLDEIPDCPVPSFADLDGEDLPTPPSPCVIGRTGSPQFIVPLSVNTLVGGSIELTVIAGDPEGPSTDECADPFLSAAYELPDDCLYAVQRLSVGPLEYFLFVAQQLGVEIPGFAVPEPEDVPEPDRNLRITSFRAGVVDESGDQGDLTEVAVGEILELDLDQILRVELTQPEEDLQTYEIPINNGAEIEEREEVHDGQWYRSWGRILSGASDDPESFNEWNFTEDVQDETSEPPDDRAFMYYVVRDGRQGVAWWWFQVERPG